MPTSKPTGPEEEDLGDKSRSWIKYSGMGVQMIAAILVFTYAGIYLDEWLGWSPVGTIVLSLVGVTAGLYLGLKDFL